MQIACVTASYVADPLGYPGGDIDWGLATERMKQSLILEALDSMLERLAPARLDGIELFYPHIWPGNLTPSLASQVRQRLAAQSMVCCATAGSVTDPSQDPYGCEELFQTAVLVGAPLIAGHMHVADIRPLSALCRKYGVRLTFENGAERDAGQILDAIQGGDEWIGANIDTGNMAAQGGDPVRAVRELGARIMHVHLKDVPAVGSHGCTELGRGIVDIQGVLGELRAVGYDGWLSIEIETGDHDPTADIIASAATIRRWLAD